MDQETANVPTIQPIQLTEGRGRLAAPRDFVSAIENLDRQLTSGFKDRLAVSPDSYDEFSTALPCGDFERNIVKIP
jgi:hypothetical protein